MPKLPVVKDGLRFIVPLIVVTVILSLTSFICITTIVGLLTIFVIYFFRDPERTIPPDKNTIVSPADGKVIGVDRLKDPETGEERLNVSIFLSVFNVHVNRIPVAGRITGTQYNPGKFLPAFREKVSELNEQNSVFIETETGIKVKVTQIAGLIARRIVCWVTTGDTLLPGDRFGLIRFGSRVDVMIPADVAVLVKTGDRVVGGETIIGHLNNNE